MEPIVISTTGIGFRVEVFRTGIIKGTPYSIMPFCERFNHYTYDQRLRQRVLKKSYFSYYRDRETCCFPLYALDEFQAFLAGHNIPSVVKELPAVVGAEVNFEMLPHVVYKNVQQRGAVEKLTAEEGGRVRGLGIQTGYGKTVSLIMSIQKRKSRAMISMTSRTEQWVKEIVAFTTLMDDKRDIRVVKGVNALTALFADVKEGKGPSIILMSTKTLQNYLEYGPTYQHLPHPLDMTEVLQIGFVAVDEAHEWYHTNFSFDIIQNASVSVPTTATFTSNDEFIVNILNHMIPDHARESGGEYVKFVNVTSYIYEGGGTLIKPHNYTRNGSYSQVKYEEYLLSVKGRPLLDNIVHRVILPIIREHYLNICDNEVGERMLFLCATKEMCNYIADLLKRTTNKTASVFVSGMPNSILERFDIIVSTPGSAGTGRDIKKLRAMIVFDATSSEARNLQYLGRLRPFPATKDTPEFAYISMACIPAHGKYTLKRTVLYGPRALTFKQRRIS